MRCAYCSTQTPTMHNDLSPQEEGRIDVLSDDSIRYWIAKLNITEQQLRNAVFIVGSRSEDVVAYLRRHGFIKNQ
jgi:hypothetical protein